MKLLKVILRDGRQVEPMEAAAGIGAQTMPGDALKVLVVDDQGQTFETYVFWRTTGRQFHLLTTSETSLFSTPIQYTDKYYMGFNVEKV